MSRDKRPDGSTRTRRRRRVVRPANVVAAVVGVLSIALGVWALIKTGLNTDHIFTPTKEVLGLPHTPTLALAEIGFGVLLLIAAATGKFGAFVVAVLGVVSLVFGVIVVSDSWSGRIHRWTAASHDTGWMFILIGVVLILAAVLPLFLTPKRTVRQAPAEPEPLLVEIVPAVPEPATAESEPAAVSDEKTGEDSRPEHAGGPSLTTTETDST